MLWKYVICFVVVVVMVVCILLVNVKYSEQWQVPVRKNRLVVGKNTKKISVDEHMKTVTNSSLVQGTKTSTKYILVAAYFRGGSTFFSQSFRQSDFKTFYSFEPLHFIPAVIVNKTLDHTREITRKDNLRNIFKCKFEKVSLRVLHTISKFPQNKLSKAFQKCFRIPNTKDENHDYCVEHLKSVCLSASVRVIKTLETSIDIIQILLKEISSLKVFHLIRDPRGMMNSHYLNGYGKGRHFSSLTKKRCKEMSEDLTKGVQLVRLHPDRFIPVLYDCVAVRPYELIKKFYNIAGLRFSEKTKLWIRAYTHLSDTKTKNQVAFNGFKKFALKQKTSHYSLTVRNSFVAANSWKINMPLKHIKEVNNICKNVLVALGLRKLETEQELRNISCWSLQKGPDFYIKDAC